jgi:FG-GAP-like repeat/Abnormal spindle-like microcephaly-assoc'd, ASPM-SPD-2-Hydin
MFEAGGPDRRLNTFRRLPITLMAFLVMACGTIFAANNPVPFIDLPVVPAAAVPGGAGFTLTVNGAGFVNGSVVNWNSSPRTTTFVSAGQITAAILASDIATASTAKITVSNPAPGGGTSNTVYFEVTTPTSGVVVAGLQIPELQGLSPLAVLASDLNNDGKLDLIVFIEDVEAANPYVALGNGDGTFQPLLAIPNATTLETHLPVLGDFNKDGNLDLALINYNSSPSTISILLGNGDGTFQPAIITSQANTFYSGLVVGDFNEDGNLDIVTNYSNGSGSGISVLLGNGDGTFQAPVDYAIQCPVSLVGDLNGDGKLDLLGFVSNDLPTPIYTQFGNGDGTFQACVTSQGLGFLVDASLADVNGDGILDLITFNFEDDPSFYDPAPVVSLGEGNGVFTALPVNIQGFPAFPPADFNGDGKLDWVVSPGVRTPLPPDDLYLEPGNGDGSFGAGVSIKTLTGSPLSPLIQGDFNGDGKMDLLAHDNSGVVLFLQGSFPVGSVSPGSLNFGNQAVGTRSGTQIVTFRNSGSVTLTLSPVNISGPNASEFGQTNTCSATLAVGAGCQITVTFTPAATGVQSATLNIPSNGLGSKTVPLIGTGTNFAMTAPSPSSVTVSPGQTAIFTFDLEPVSGFNHVVALTCEGTPAGAKCAVPPSVTLDGSSNIKVDVTVTTTARSMAMNHDLGVNSVRWLASGLLGFPLIVSLAGLGVRRWSQVYRWTSLLLIIAVILLVPACGGGNGGSGGSSGTPAGTYVLTVAGKYATGGTTLVHETTLTLIVE